MVMLNDCAGVVDHAQRLRGHRWSCSAPHILLDRIEMNSQRCPRNRRCFMQFRAIFKFVPLRGQGGGAPGTGPAARTEARCAALAAVAVQSLPPKPRPTPARARLLTTEWWLPTSSHSEMALKGRSPKKVLVAPAGPPHTRGRNAPAQTRGACSKRRLPKQDGPRCHTKPAGLLRHEHSSQPIPK